MPTIVYAQQQQRYDTAANWIINNPVLLEGEMGVESDTRKFKFGNGVNNWNSLAYYSGTFTKTISYTTTTLAANASVDFEIAAATQFQLLSVTASVPAWIRVYGTSAARAADTRTSPGGTAPNPGTEFYAELVTTITPQTIRLSPVPLVQTTGGNAFIRARNNGTAAQVLALEFYVFTLEG